MPYEQKPQIKKAIYTANIDNYDIVKPINEIFTKGWDKYYYTDKEPRSNVNLKNWEVVIFNKNNLSNYDLPHNTSIARYIKINSHKILPTYEITLWIDASKLIINNINNFINIIPFHKYDFITAIHPERTCIYKELYMKRVIDSVGENNIEDINEFLMLEKFPENYNLQETQFLLRRNNQLVNQINDCWWNCLYQNEAYRDQIWLSYVLFKLKYKSKICLVSKELEREYLKYIKHGNRNNYSREMLNRSLVRTRGDIKYDTARIRAIRPNIINERNVNQKNTRRENYYG